MTNIYGDTSEPGTVTEETSADNVSRSTEAPAVPCVIGPADIANASDPASANTVYRITRESTARERFGPQASSMLTTAIIDQLGEGANPIYAVAPEETSVSAEDLSTQSTADAQLANYPTTEDPADFTVSVDGTEQDVTLVRDDPSDMTVPEGEAYVRATDGLVSVDAAPSTSFDVSYTHLDYTSALDAFEAATDATDEVDFLTALQEEASVQQDVVTTAQSLASEQDRMVALVAPNGVRIDPQNYTQTYDSSRVQVQYPTRFEDGSSMLAAVAGMRANIGVSGTPINQTLSSPKKPDVDLDSADRAALISEKVNPIQSTAAGGRVKDDLTAIMDDNTAEQNLDFGFKRLAMDYVYDIAEANETPFIGRFNQNGVREALKDLIAYQLTALQESNIINSYSVDIEATTSTEATVYLSVNAPAPLRFVRNKATIGTSV